LIAREPEIRIRFCRMSTSVEPPFACIAFSITPSNVLRATMLRWQPT
jgi:hypothetical protein